MSRTDKDRPFWVISNDPEAKNNVFRHYCYRGYFAMERECQLGNERDVLEYNGYAYTVQHCGYFDPREIFWYREIDGPTETRARDRDRGRVTVQEANAAFRDGTFEDFEDDYDWGYADRLRQEWRW